MAKNNVTINGRTPVTKDSEGTFMGFPDVCKTPTPSGPVPVPCLNVAKSANLKNGSVSVKINGAPVCLEDSYLEPSTGDEAGSAGGIMSGKTRGKAEPLMYSFNSKLKESASSATSTLSSAMTRTLCRCPSCRRSQRLSWQPRSRRWTSGRKRNAPIATRRSLSWPRYRATA